MATPFESAQLILTLYEQRREETMRKARDFVFTIDPRSVDEYLALIFGPNGAYVRQVTSYWEMAATFVVNGAIDPKMFNEANAEHVLVFSKFEPFLNELREKTGNPNVAKNLEAVVLGMPDGKQKVDQMRERIRGMLAGRAAAAAEVAKS